MQRIDRGPIYRQKSIQKSRYFLIPNRHRLNRDQRDDHIIFAPIPSLKHFSIPSGNSMQIFNPANSLHTVQSLYINSFEMHRQRGTGPSVFKSVGRTQTYCQKEERFTVQNKITDASAHHRTAPNRKTIHSTQILICHKERSAVQNKKSAGAIETASRFGEYRKNLMNQPGKTHP